MPPDVPAVLGIDAAWTDHEPSGVALLRQNGSKWQCLRAAPSYSAFCGDFSWEDPIAGTPVDAQAVLSACRHLLGGVQPRAIAVDMPLAATRIGGRRCADDNVSQRFGHRKCATHSPSAARPGPTGRWLHESFAGLGYCLATSSSRRTLPAILEVYPHVALLGLTGRDQRLPYKVAKNATYWPGHPPETRKQLLVEEWSAILASLRQIIDGIDLPLPDRPQERTFQHLKRYEDAIDALVSAWVAIEFLKGTALPLGDEAAAIWVPASSMCFANHDAA
jgi:predicted RNase H-like nuclease